MKSAFNRFRFLKYFTGVMIFILLSQYKMKVHWFIEVEQRMKAPQGDHLEGQMEATKDGQQTVASNKASNYDGGSRESLFLERRNRIAETCETHGNFTDARYEYHTEVPTVIVGENKSFVYYAVAKASSCLWKSVLSMIEFGKDYSSLYKWYKRLPRLPEYRSAHTPQETLEFLEEATSFMFVREPYGWLFSAYIDKLFHPNIVFWRGSTSRRILRSLRTNVTWGHNSDFAYDVTFAEMIKFLVLTSKSDRFINEHFAPMYSGCNPCGYRKIYVGKLETFAADSKFIISKLDRNFDYKGLLQRITTKSAAHDAVARVRSLFQVLNATQSAPYPRYNLFLRTWRNFQIRGLLSKTYEMPLTEQEVTTLTQKQFEKVLNDALAKPANTTLVRSQKREAMLQAYSTVSRDLLRELARFVETDCALYGYDREPKWLFEAPSNAQRVFNYFDAL